MRTPVLSPPSPPPRKPKPNTSTPTIIEFVTGPALLGLSISPAQRTLLKSIYGLSLTSEELELWRLCTERESYPAKPFSEVTVISGARGGKDSRIAVPVLLFEAIFGQHERHVSKGERPVLPLIALGIRGTRIAFQYARDYLVRSPALSTMLAGEPTAGEIPLTNGLSIMCFPSTQRATRGFSIPAAVLDELAFFRLEGQADSDAEIQTSVRRGMINFPRTCLVKISTPYMRSGILHDDFKRAFGKPDADLLVWRAPTSLMNPSITAERLAREQRLDPLRFAREYLGEFAEDISAFLPSAWIDAAVSGRPFLAAQPGTFRYICAVDTSGGGLDAFPLAICHVEGTGPDRKIVQDYMKGWTKPRTATANLAGVVAEIAEIVKKSYGEHVVYGDRYAAQWVVEAFRREGITYTTPSHRVPGEPEPKYMDKSAAYAECSPLFAQGVVELLDHPQLIRELKLLESRPQAGGKIRVDHPSGSHDDYANAACLALAMAARSSPKPWARSSADAFMIGSPSGRVAIAGSLGQLGAVQRGEVGGQAAHLNRPYGRFG